MACSDITDGAVQTKEIGATWISGPWPVRYVVQCVLEIFRINVRMWKCFYDDLKGNSGEVETGCYRKFASNVIVKCSIDKYKDGQAQVIHVDNSAATEMKLRAAGFNQC